MQEDPLLPDALAALSRQFAEEEDEAERLTPSASPTLEQVRQFLIAHVTRLLDRNPALLMSILYRVDVAEREVKRVLAESDPAAIPGDLADLLIQRQLQKIRTRRTYGRS